MKDRKQILKILALIMSMIMLLAGCNSGSAAEKPQDDSGSNGKVMILYTSDMHCGVEEGFGLAGLQAVRENLIDYIKDDLGGEVDPEYADPYGQGRITIIQ